MSELEEAILILKDISRDIKQIVSMMDRVHKDKPPKKGYIDRLDVEKLLRRSESTIRRLTADGTLKALRIGRTSWYKESDIFKKLDEFLK